MNHGEKLGSVCVSRLQRRVRTQRLADPAGFLEWLNGADPLAPEREPPYTRREHFLAAGVPVRELDGPHEPQVIDPTT